MTATWEGVIGYVETRTKDGRCLGDPDPDARWDRPLQASLRTTRGLDDLISGKLPGHIAEPLGRLDHVAIVGTEIRARGSWAPTWIPSTPLHCGVDVMGDDDHTESGVLRLVNWRIIGVTVHDIEDDAWTRPTTITVTASGPGFWQIISLDRATPDRGATTGQPAPQDLGFTPVGKLYRDAAGQIQAHRHEDCKVPDPEATQDLPANRWICPDCRRIWELRSRFWYEPEDS
jgi:hypothetical protein